MNTIRLKVIFYSLSFALIARIFSYIIINFDLLPLFQNTGIAFSLPLSGLPQKIVTIVAISALFYFSNQFVKNKSSMLAVSLIIGGGLANAFERFYYGYVIDYFNIQIWPVFNMADSFITIGAALLIFNLIKSN